MEAEILLAHVLNLTRENLYTSKDFIPSNQKQKEYTQVVDVRSTGKPIAYIVSRKDFWSLSLYINENVLIPRPETELLVETLLTRLEEHQQKTILDLGTGSGAIAISIAYERQNWQVVGSDRSKYAIDIAKNNAKKYHLENIDFTHGDWLEPFQGRTFDAIVSNPPYVRTNDPHFKGEISFEPAIALDGGETGLESLQIIVESAPQCLNDSGILAVEHGYDQAQKVTRLFKLAGFNQIEVLCDLAGLERVTLGYLS